MTTYKMDLEPLGLRVELDENMTVLDAAQKAGIQITALCGGDGWCGKCRVQRMFGELSPMTDVEKEVLTEDDKRNGYRLACQTHVLSDVKFNIPPEALSTAQRLQTEGSEEDIEMDLFIEAINITLEPPTVHDLRSDVIRLKGALEAKGFPDVRIEFPLLGSLSQLIRDYDWHFLVALRNRNEVITILPEETSLLGLAVDIGTTKMAGYLVDLSNGLTLAKVGMGNPQVPYGEDVVSRIAYVNSHEEGATELQSCLADSLNEMIDQLCLYASQSPEQIVDAVFVGNTAIHHLFLGLPVEQLGAAPYVASVSDAIYRRAASIGLKMAPGAYLYMPPNIAGFVGADHVSMLLATAAKTKSDLRNETIVALDIGTNTEISLAHEGRLLSCSCASGPAFEGAHITNGMRAMPGAIEGIRINHENNWIQTIDKAAPIGICGSGILDAVAEMSKNKVINKKGQISPDAPNVAVEGKRKRKFILVPPEQSGTGNEIVVSRQDVNEIQLAKGAIRAGIEVLLLEADITSDKIDQFIIAGAFGTYLNLENAVEIGMLPNIPLERFQQVGNAAGIGAKYFLLSKKNRQFVKTLIDSDEYIELTAHPQFTPIYIKALLF
ncbi:MAG: ASKHA domain-containing protein [Anaerolineaceae bacterium]|nr:ASKHA domain-containing protein [Anaerolineaceae bacterium]